jgi:hypothetical protein
MISGLTYTEMCRQMEEAGRMSQEGRGKVPHQVNTLGMNSAGAGVKSAEA